jgi:pimeloyl-ACP methyl ester carboxylesterase
MTAIKRRLALAVGGVALLAVGLPALARSWIAHAIVDAPNARIEVVATADAAPRVYEALGVSQQVRIEVRSGASPISMSVWIFRPESAARGTVLLLHGIRSERIQLVDLARQVAAHGYCAVLPDLPGHGRSSGKWLTYGVREAPDLSQMLDNLQHSNMPVDRVGVIGFSYGAAVGIQLAARDSRIRAVVAVAPFSSLRDVVPAYIHQYLGIGALLLPSTLIGSAIDRAGELGAFNPDAASPLLAIKKTHAQVLLIHGRRDSSIPFSQSVALHAAAADHSRLILLASEDHASISNDGTRTIATEGMRWLDDGFESR